MEITIQGKVCSAPIIKFYKGFIVLAHNSEDYHSKCGKIDKGFIDGFYMVDVESYASLTDKEFASAYVGVLSPTPPTFSAVWEPTMHLKWVREYRTYVLKQLWLSDEGERQWRLIDKEG